MKHSSLRLFLIVSTLFAAEPLLEKSAVFPPGFNGIARFNLEWITAP